MAGIHDTLTLIRDRPRPAATGLARGSVLGRYVALRALGSGGMGIVYLAYDAELDREVAIKLCRSAPQRRDGKRHRERLLAEAKALARLSHPNVVQVFDAGVHEEDVYFVMELVEGETLASWLRRAPRSRRAILEWFRDAAKGLAAIHAASLVHRDVKPSNLIIGRDGRLRVVDLGLASSVDRTAGEDPVGRGGTPAYMAPEQREGAGTDARSDQFSFCLSLLEALTGRLPDASSSLASTIAAARLPGWLSRLLSRGLAHDPAQRFPSMTVLSAAFAGPPKRARRGLMAASLALVVSAAYWTVQATGGTGQRLCLGAEQQLLGIWDESRRAAVVQAWRALAPSWSGAVAEAVAARVDAYAEGWAQMHGDVCRATRVRGEQSEQLMDLRMACLGERRMALAGVAAVLAEPSDELLPRAMRMVDRLPGVAPCADVRSLLAMAPPPSDPDQAARIDRASADLARSKALEDAGLLEAARPPAEAGLAAALEVDYPPLRARALRRLAELEGRGGDMAAMRQGLYEALQAAQLGAADREAVAIWLDLIIVGWWAGDFTEANGYAAVAEATLTRIGGDAELESQLFNRRGMLANRQKHFAQAVEHFERSRAAYARAFGPERLAIANATQNLAIAYRGLGRYRDAEALYFEALDQLWEMFGEEHPDRASMLHNLSLVQLNMGEPRAAVVSARSSLTLGRRLFGSGHPQTLRYLLGYGEALLENGEVTAALAPLEQAHAADRGEGGDPIEAADAAFGLARALEALDREPQRQVQLVQAARHGYRAAGPRASASLERLQAWQEDHHVG